MNDTTVGALAITFSVLVLTVPRIRYDGMTDERTVTPGDRNKRLQGQTRDIGGMMGGGTTANLKKLAKCCASCAARAQDRSS